MKKNPEENPKPDIHPDLVGFDIHINSFGELVSTHSIDQINEFLNKSFPKKKERKKRKKI